MAWSDVEAIRLSSGTASGGDFTFSKAIAANLAQSKKGMGAAALDRARNQAVRDAIQDAGATLASDAWQLVHPSTPWSLLAVFAPAAATLSYPAVPCLLETAAGELSGLFATRYETLRAGPETAWASALVAVLENLNRAERLAIPDEAVSMVEAFEAEVASLGLAFASIKTPLTATGDVGVKARAKWLKCIELRRVAATLMGYFRDMAERLETTVSFSPSLVSYAGGLNTYDGYASRVAELTKTLNADEVILALLRKALEAKSVSAIAPIGACYAAATQNEPAAQRVAKVQELIAMSADLVS